MSTTKKPIDGGAAFPEVRVRDGDNYNPPTKVYYRGMTLRDWFAGQIAGEVYTTRKVADGVLYEFDPVETAKKAYAFADAMIEARKGGSHE